MNEVLRITRLRRFVFFEFLESRNNFNASTSTNFNSDLMIKLTLFGIGRFVFDFDEMGFVVLRNCTDMVILPCIPMGNYRGCLRKKPEY